MKLAQKLLLTTINQVADIEREFIAKNLHDEIGSSLNIIKLSMTKIKRNINNPELISELIDESIDQLGESINNIRNISNELSTPALAKLGLEKGLSELFRKINSSGEVNILFDSSYNKIRLSGLVEVHLYRITQEVINNIIKHADAKQVTVLLLNEINLIKITIVHDGNGITKENAEHLLLAGSGVGLRNIQARAEQIDAKILYGASENRLFVTTIELVL